MIQSSVEAVGTFRLVLRFGFYFNFENIFYVPTFSRNLISSTHLSLLGFKFVFEHTTCNIYKNNNFKISCVLFKSNDIATNSCTN